MAYCAVLRYPAAGDFRIGNPSAEEPLTARDRAICARLAPTLRQYGIHLAGLDVIGGYLICTAILAAMVFPLGPHVRIWPGKTGKAGGSQLPTDPSSRSSRSGRTATPLSTYPL